MNSPTKELPGSANLLVLTLFMQCAFLLSVLLDIPVARQVIGFIYFTFIPGLIISKLLGLDSLGTWEKVVFSLGLSVAFLMIMGLALNGLSLVFGFSQPLSFAPLMLFSNGLIIVAVALAHLKSKKTHEYGTGIKISLSWSSLFFIIPILSVVGALLVTIYANNLILLFMILLIVCAVLVGFISRKSLPIIILAISISILFHSALSSQYLISHGSDVPGESFLATVTQQNARWNVTAPFPGDDGYNRMYSMLSVTILPVVYSTLLKVDVTWVFKALFPFIFSFVPLILYTFWQRLLGKRGALIASVLMIAEATFFTEMLGLGRQMIAELFLALLVVVVLERRIAPAARNVCLVIFSFGLIVSHYGIAEIFFALILIAWVVLVFTRRIQLVNALPFVVTFAVLMFFWYIFTSSAGVFESAIDFGNYVASQLGDFFDPASRGVTVLRGLGLEGAPSVLNLFSRVFAYLTELLIVIGFVGLVSRRVRIRMSQEHFMVIASAVMILVAIVLVPGLANTMNVTRFYHVLLFFIAPLFVVGASFTTNSIFGQKKERIAAVLMLFVLIPYFLFQTGFVYEIAQSDNWSLPLSGYRMSPSRLYNQLGYVDSFSVSGTQWLSKNVNVYNSRLYSDAPSRYNVLTSYGMVYRGFVNDLNNATIVDFGGVVYLSPLNTQEEKIGEWNLTSLAFSLDDLNRVYTNLDSEVYKNVLP